MEPDGVNGKLLVEIATTVKHMSEDMKAMREDIHEFKRRVEQRYISKEQFEAALQDYQRRIATLERVVYGLIALTLLTVFGAILSLVIG